MNQAASEDYRDKGYAHLRGFVPREVCNAILARMKVDLNRQGISLDKIEREGPLLRQKAPELYGYHYPMFTSFLWGMTPAMEELTGEALLAFRQLVRFTARLHNSHLKRLVSDVLGDPAVSVPFFTLPASESGYHHGYEGGLLVHSTDMLEYISLGKDAIFNGKRDEMEVTQVGYLFHDLGKVCTSAPDVSREDRAIRHEQHTLRMLRPQLDRLAQDDPRSALLLREILFGCATRARDRKWGGFVGARLVTELDGFSTQKDRDAANDSNFQSRMLGLTHV